MSYSIVHGDVLATLREMPDNSAGAVLCDLPYGYRFMGKKWDYDVPSVEVWREALRVLKPGAPLLSFGGARTFHRIAIGIEDAGFDLRDCLMWLYGKGFPKSQNIGLAIDKAAGAIREVVGTRTLTGNAAMSTKEKGGTYGVQVGSVGSKEVPVTAPSTELAKLWDGYGTALKPAYEPIVMARKPMDGTMAQNIEEWGVGGLAIDACRVGSDLMPKTRSDGVMRSGDGSMNGGNTGRIDAGTAEGRWPANLLLDESAGAELDAQTGNRPSVPYRANVATGAVLPLKSRTAGEYREDGGPSRFFYCAKVSTRERELGCEALPMRSAGEVHGREDGADGLNSPHAGASREAGARNHHPTLKPIALTQWLAALVRPPTECARLLVPYSGAGSEMIGAMLAGWVDVVGIEADEVYVAIAHARIAAHVIAKSQLHMRIGDRPV